MSKMMTEGTLIQRNSNVQNKVLKYAVTSNETQNKEGKMIDAKSCVFIPWIVTVSSI